TGSARTGAGTIGTSGADKLFIPLDPKGVNSAASRSDLIDLIDFWGDLNFGKKISAIVFCASFALSLPAVCIRFAWSLRMLIPLSALVIVIALQAFCLKSSSKTKA